MSLASGRAESIVLMKRGRHILCVLFCMHIHKTDLCRPEIRDAFILSPEMLGNDDCLNTLATMVSVNWPWSSSEVLCVSQDTTQMQMTASFEQYVSHINNWSLSPAVLHRFPALIDKAWIKPASDAVNMSDHVAQTTSASSCKFVL